MKPHVYVILADHVKFTVFSLLFLLYAHAITSAITRRRPLAASLRKRTEEKQRDLCSLPCVLVSAGRRANDSRRLQLSVPGLSGGLRATEKKTLFLVDRCGLENKWRRSRSLEVGQRSIHYSQPLALEAGRNQGDCLPSRHYVMRNPTHANRPVSKGSINQ